MTTGTLFIVSNDLELPFMFSPTSTGRKWVTIPLGEFVILLQDVDFDDPQLNVTFTLFKVFSRLGVGWSPAQHVYERLTPLVAV